MRKRMIDPDIWQDEKFNKLTDKGKLLFIGLITVANDFGKLRGNPIYLRTHLFPYDDNNNIVEKELEMLIKSKMIIKYNINGETFIKLTNWDKYQTLIHPAKDNIEEPSLDFQDGFMKPSRRFHETVKMVSPQDKLSKDKLSKANTTAKADFNPKDWLVDVFCISYKKHTVTDYTITWAKDTATAKRLFQALGGAVGSLNQLLETFFEMWEEAQNTPKDWLYKKTPSLGIFSSILNTIKLKQLDKEDTKVYH
jgi:hypothetical protein